MMRILEWLTNTVAWFYRIVADWFVDAGQWFDTKFFEALDFLRYLGRLLASWWYSRRFHLLLQSLPALATLIAIMGVGVAMAYTQESELATLYRQQAKANMAAENFAGAQVCYQKLVQLHRTDPSNAYGLAICLDKMGQKNRAMAMMTQLAPSDRLGYGPAHLWVVRNLAAGGGIQLQVLETHLRFAWNADHESQEVNRLLGQLYLDMNRPAEAEKYLAVAAQNSLEHRLLLARAYAIQGKREPMLIEASRVVDKARADIAVSPEVPRYRLILTDAFILRREFTAAEAVLTDGLMRPFGKSYKRPLAMLYVNWYIDLVKNEKGATVGDQLSVLQRGLSADPDCPEVIMALYTLMQSHKSESASIRKSLLAELARGKAISSINFVLGFEALDRGEWKAAKTYFEIAYQLEPRMAIAANNLAWLMAFGLEPDLPRALATIKSLVERFPDEPRFRGTRGHILAKNGDYQEALIELLKALPAYGETPELHERLAEVYSQVGLESSARVHRDLAKEKRAR